MAERDAKKSGAVFGTVIFPHSLTRVRTNLDDPTKEPPRVEFLAKFVLDITELDGLHRRAGSSLLHRHRDIMFLLLLRVLFRGR